MVSKNTYIDIFAGCGGLSLGLHEAGWQGLFAIEKSPFAFETLQHNLIDNLNHFDWPNWLERKNHDIENILKNYNRELLSLRGKVDMVAGGPPCQGFSTAGKRKENDQRNDLINSYVSFIRLVQPRVIFFENVKGFTQKFNKNKSKGINYSEYVKTKLKRSGKNFVGYEVYGDLIDFSKFGVPQKRTRFILVGIRKDIANELNHTSTHFFDLLKSHRSSFLANKGIGPSTNLHDAISDLLQENGKVPCPDSNGFDSAVYGSIDSSYQKLMRSNTKSKIPDSHRFARHKPDTITLFKSLISNAPKGKRIAGKKRDEFNIKKRGIFILNPDGPSPTLTSHPDDYVHFSEPRTLSVREYARIQTFPDWFEFKCKYTTGGKLRVVEVPRYTQVGNAIPPMFGEQAGLVLKQMING